MRSTFSAGQDRKLLPVLFGIVVLSVVGFAQDLPTAKPESIINQQLPGAGISFR